MCQAFGAGGWRVGVHYYERKREAIRTAALVRERGGAAVCVQADVRDGKQTQDMVDRLLDRWSRLDALVCSAGVASSGLVLRTGLESWQAVLAANLTGVFHCLRAAGAVMLKQRAGTVMVIGSLAGIQGRAGQAAYAAAKAGLVGLVRTAAREWGSANIRVNLVLPGWHRTPLAGASFPDDAAAEHVLGRTPSLDAVADAIYRLALLPDSSGQVWNLDSRIF